MNISGSIRRLCQLFIILFVALSGGLVYWQVAVGQQVTSNVHNIRHCMKGNAPIRGRIFDRNGVLLADSQPIDPKNPFKGALCAYQRHYYLKGMPSLADLIGFYISPLYNSTGIEHAFDDYLSGRQGLTQLTNNFNTLVHRSPVGDDIYLTIDVRIQKIAEQYFDKDSPSYNSPTKTLQIDNVNVFPSKNGAVVITDPHTGEILAMVTRPYYDSNRVASGDINYFNKMLADPSAPLLERALEGQYVPGSIYKTMTLMAALDSGQFQLSTPFDRKHALGPIRIAGEDYTPAMSNIEGYTHSYPVSLAYGFAHSDNIIFAGVGTKLGADTWLKYNQRFFVGQEIPFDLPVAKSSVTPLDGSKFTDTLLAEDSFGQGVDFITPLQMSLLDDAIANNGQLMKPMLVQKIQAPDGTVLQSFAPQVLANPISDQTASQVRDALYGVARCGSGLIVPEWHNSPWSIIAKTGTGEVGGGKGAHAWLLSQAPYQNPRLTIVGLRENGGEGGNLNGPMIADMYNAIYTHVIKLQLPPTPDPEEPYCFDHGLLN